MSKTKEIVAAGVILFFLGMALSPATATTPAQLRSEVNAIGTLTSQIKLAENDLVTMEKILPALMDKMQSATSYSDLINTIQAFMNQHGRRPILVLILTLIIKIIDFQYKFGQFRPVRKTAFIISWGFTNKVLSLSKNKFNLARPFSLWYYSGRSNVVLNSRTIIIDPFPFGVRMINGRQVGAMTNFIGLFLHLKGAIGDKMHTLFIGYAGSIRAFDLSPNS
jgi:hypothetical protein